MKYSYLLLSFLLASPIKENSEKYIFSQFSKEINISLNTLKLNDKIKSIVQNQTKQAFYRDKLYYWKISKNDTTIAYAFLDNVKGKSMPITFMVIMNADGSIKNSNIVKYREAYGGEISNERWLNQFNEKNHNSKYEVGKEIDAITGATISVNSISKGIRKIAILYDYVKDNLD
ncbi:MAG: FMN-binding protein [Candidatus Neomarinimicrobiota bacterium]|nr:FMN-binding protein [Candidatus Neomarinimicrobiota bacterium]|tara:strand:+ start:1976 stop:2497 length:522 start_codon:yes stop_codon:yes gene_type:complete